MPTVCNFCPQCAIFTHFSTFNFLDYMPQKWNRISWIKIGSIFNVFKHFVLIYYVLLLIIFRTLTSFHFVFLRFNMLIMHRLCLVLSITKNVICYFSGTTTTCSPSNITFSLKQYILKSFKTLLVGTYFYSISKNINKTKNRR